MKSGARREEIATVARPGDMTAPLLRTSHVHSKLRILGPMLLAAFCLAAPIGTFDDESAIAESQTPGHTVFNSSFGEYTVTGTGDIGETSDGFHYVWKKVSGDVTIGADVRFAVNGAAGDRKAALMIRQTLDPRAPYAAAVLRGDGQAVFQYRPDTGATSRSADVGAKTDLASTVYVSLERRGDAFTMSAGKRLKRGGPVPFNAPTTLTMNGPVYVGLAVASADPKAQETAVFGNVYVQPVRAQ